MFNLLHEEARRAAATCTRSTTTITTTTTPSPTKPRVVVVVFGFATGRGTDLASPYAKKFGNLSSTFDPKNELDASRELRQQRVAAHLTLSDPEPKDLHTTTALREQLELKRRELKAAKAELSFTGDIMDMLRADIAKSDAESESRLQVVQEAKDMKLRIAAEVDVLSEQISTRDLIMSDLRFNLDQACTDRDLKEKNLRTLREHGDLQHVDHGIGQRRTY